MQKKLLDFHFHSRHSDGSEEVADIIKEAKRRNITALALTDHNTDSGVDEFMAGCKNNEILGLEGTEIYTNFPETNWSKYGCGQSPDVVILGKKLNWEAFREYQENLAKYWFEYWLPATLDKLHSAGMDVPEMDNEEMLMQIMNKKSKLMIPLVLHDVPRNPKNWPALLNACRQFDHGMNLLAEDIEKNPVRWANRCLYNLGGVAYVPRIFPEWSVVETVRLAKNMNGVLFAAHPVKSKWTDKHIDYFVECGGKGIEVWQYGHSQEQIELLLKVAKKYSLVMSGGSDWHGANDETKLGCWDKPSSQMPDWVLRQLLDNLPD